MAVFLLFWNMLAEKLYHFCHLLNKYGIIVCMVGIKNCTYDCCLLYKLSAIFGSPPCMFVNMSMLYLLLRHLFLNC